GYALGGEQSGHVVMPSHATTGDGILTGLSLLSQVAATGRSLAELASVVTKLPQVLVNVPVADRRRAAVDPAVAAATEAAAAARSDGDAVRRRCGRGRGAWLRGACGRRRGTDRRRSFQGGAGRRRC